MRLRELPTVLMNYSVPDGPSGQHSHSESTCRARVDGRIKKKWTWIWSLEIVLLSRRRSVSSWRGWSACKRDEPPAPGLKTIRRTPITGATETTTGMAAVRGNDPRPSLYDE
jgi:hypothetical protein